MAGVALLLDLLRKNSPGSCASAKSLYPCGLLSATVAASAVAAGSHFAPRGLFSDPSFAFCDAGAAWTEDYIPGVESAFEKFYSGKSSSEDTIWQDSLKNTAKEYTIELKPLFSAFGLKPLAMTSLRSFLHFYLPLLEPRQSSEDDDDLLQDTPREEPVDLVVPFKKSLKQIARETSVVTIRRVLERLAVHYLSQRMAWKLLKDVPRSAKRKAARGMPTMIFFGCVSRTTFRAHFLAVAASWIVQVGIDTYRCLFRRSDDDLEEPTTAEIVHQLGKRICSTTVKCSASLVLASIGAGLFACFHPSIGQWIGCALGDLGGLIIVTVCCEKFFHLDV